MDLTDKSQLLKYIKENGIWAKKGLSQNFLIDKNALDKIVESAQIKKDDLIVEIGPGLGTLTQELIKKAGKVIAIEKDEKLAKLLLRQLSNSATKQLSNNYKLVNSDILNVNLNELLGAKKYKVVANIPYAITSKIIQLFLTAEKKPDLIVMLVQKEVAERICAKPGDMSVLAISVQLYGQPEIVDIVTKESFFPSPKVDSAILRIVIASETKQSFPLDRHATLAMTKEEEKEFFRCVNIGFSSKRKKLINNLSAGYHLDRKIVSDIMKKSEINEGARAQELKIEDWKALSFEINKEHK